MISKDIKSFYHFYPSNVTLVGARKGEKVNFMAAAWNTGLSFDPPLFGVSISAKRFSHDLILNSKEFSCNFLSYENIEMVHGSGKVSGRDLDKTEVFSIPLEKSEVISCPTIKSAYAAYECRLVHHYPVGDHNFFVGEVVAIHVNDNVISKAGLLDPDKLQFTMYLGKNTYISCDPKSVRCMPPELNIGNK